MQDWPRLQRASRAILREGLVAGHSYRLVITSGSMQPALRRGDAVLVRQVAWRALRCGDIVICEVGGTLVAHRLLRVARRRECVLLWTKGDASPSLDPPRTLECYVGRVEQIERGAQVTQLDGRAARLTALVRAGWSLLRPPAAKIYRRVKSQLALRLFLLLCLLTLSARGASAAVTISSFDAQGGRSQIQLTWTTASELKNFGFNVERSSDKLGWSKIGFVQSSVPCLQSVLPLVYGYTDSNLPPATRYYYRLQLVGQPCGDANEYFEQIVSATTASGSPTPTVTALPTLTPTLTPSPSPSATPSVTASATATRAPSSTPVPPTATPLPPSATALLPASATPTPSVTPSVTFTATPTRSFTPTATRTSTPQASPTPAVATRSGAEISAQLLPLMIGAGALGVMALLAAAVTLWRFNGRR